MKSKNLVQRLADFAGWGAIIYLLFTTVLFVPEPEEKILDSATLMAFEFLELQEKGEYEKAIEVGHQVLKIREVFLGPDDPDTTPIILALGYLYKLQGHYGKAEPLLQRAMDVNERMQGPDHPDTDRSLNQLALLYIDQGKYPEAEKLLLRSLVINTNNSGRDYSRASTFNNLALLFSEQANYVQAEPYYLRALDIIEKTLGDEHEDMENILMNLGSIYAHQGNHSKAEALFLRALNIEKKTQRLNGPKTALLLNHLASNNSNLGNKEKAEELFLRALDLNEQNLGPYHPSTGNTLNNLAVLYADQGDYFKAESLILRALEISEKTLGPNHPDTALNLNNLAAVYKSQKKYAEAETLYFRALSIREKALGPNHPFTAHSLSALADLYSSQGSYYKAQPFSKSAVEIFERRAALGASDNALAQKGAVNEIKNNVDHFYSHALVSYRSAYNPFGKTDDFLSLQVESYSSSQYSLHTSAGTALGQAAARFAVSEDSLAKIVRQRQDLIGEWSFINEQLASFIGSIGKNRNKKKEQTFRDRLPAIDREIAEIDVRLEADFPEYFALTSPKPLSLEDTQELLFDNEALVMFLTGDEGTLVFAVTKEEIDWALVDVNASVLDEAVRVLRVSLENPQSAFPRGHAHGIYKKLMSGVENVFSDKDHVFLVPSGALGSIPLGVLVVEDPDGDNSSPIAMRGTKWWGTQQALTTLPSVSSLKALRLFAKDGRGKEPFAGFGNPILDGPKSNNDNRSVKLASRGTASYFRGKYGDVDAIRTLVPLPQTETELLSLANAMRAKPEQSLWLGDRATEANLKKADLSEKRVLAFATHGLMSGEMSGLAEPALVLTPPQEATDEDDGLLTASEAALLNLNADWVILSACNTAAADQPGADGLSGLARSFFYAGARSMLVSHWPVRDDAAARLTTTAITLQDKDPNMSRSEALRRSMLVLMNDTSDPTLAHPSAWAPFVIVGEGGSAISIDP